MALLQLGNDDRAEDMFHFYTEEGSSRRQGRAGTAGVIKLWRAYLEEGKIKKKKHDHFLCLSTLLFQRETKELQITMVDKDLSLYQEVLL